MPTSGSDGDRCHREVPRHVAVVLGRDARPSTVRDFYVWCDELGVQTATVCLPDTADRGVYTEAVADLEPPVRVVEGDRDGRDEGADRRVLSYLGGREEIVDAFRRLARDVEKGDLSSEDVDADTVAERLVVPGEPDLLIEVSEFVLSDVLVWQTVYSELCYVDELHKDALRRCIEDYRERDRRYGR
ncbi:MAG: undecaprenyl diphosphate synthase family protein [Halobacteria archaeon]